MFSRIRPNPVFLFLVISGTFFLEAFAFTSWLSRLPDIRDSFNFSEIEIGILLAGIPIGSLVFMPITGYLLTFNDLRKILFLNISLLAAGLIFIGIFNSLFGLFFSAIILGMGTGSMGVSMNAGAHAIEVLTKKPIMSKCHASFSLGLGVGAVCGGLVAGESISYVHHMYGVGIVTLLIGLLLCINLPSIKPEKKSNSSFSLPSKAMLLPCLIGFLILMSEGIIVDWSSLYASDVLNVSAVNIGILLTAYSIGMFSGRVFGDYVTANFPQNTVFFLCTSLAIISNTIAVVSSNIPLSIGCFFMSGLGMSVLYPILLRSVANAPGTVGINLASVSTFAYLGFLSGPPLIGILGEFVGLRYILLVIVVNGILISFIARNYFSQREES